MRKEETHPPSFCQTAQSESAACSVKDSCVRVPQCCICNDSHYSQILYCKFTYMLAFISTLNKQCHFVSLYRPLQYGQFIESLNTHTFQLMSIKVIPSHLNISEVHTPF